MPVHLAGGMTMPGLLVDAHDRSIDYLRISINRACNYACVHCDLEGDVHDDPGMFLSPRDAAAIVSAFLDAGPIKKVKITGGEPLLHPGILELVGAIHALPGITDISLTTNGYFLADLAGPLKAAGLDRVNVSLCSLDKDVYTRVTGVDGLDRVLRGIDAALDAGLVPIKINLVLLKGINEGELDAFITFCGKKGLRLQLIELHGIEGVHDGPRHDFIAAHHLDVENALRAVAEPVNRVEHRHMQHRKIVHFASGAAVEMVKVTPSFCARCTKLRVTAAGNVKPCLMRPGLDVPLLDVISRARGDPLGKGAVLDAIATAVRGRHPYVARDDGGDASP